MRSIIFALFFPFALAGQPFLSVELKPVSFPNLPSVQSYAFGVHTDGKWVVIGGRIDGLHLRRPFEAFDPDFNNTDVFVIDRKEKMVWKKSVLDLPTTLKEQLHSTNMEFFQDGNTLYLIGGYGFSPSKDEFITHPYLTVVDLNLLTQAVVTNGSLQPAFAQIFHEKMAVTGGQLQKLGDYFYLVGGQKFEGSYNPMGPNHGPGFSQQYTDEIRKFKIERSGATYEIKDYSAVHDETNLHRRDYNLIPQKFSDGEYGFTAFSGVFQHNMDLPFLNSVDIKPAGYFVNNNFSQLLCQYHTAHLPVFDPENNRMHTLFFGGIGQYYYNNGGTLVNDTDVPFVKTVSMVTRHSDGRMQEDRMPLEMPGFFGAGAEFIANEYLPAFENGILNLAALDSSGRAPVGFIFGGIRSTLPNVLFLDGDNLSVASSTIFEVYLKKMSTTPAQEIPENTNPLSLKIFPNPADTGVTISYHTPEKAIGWIMLQDETGKIVKAWQTDLTEPGSYQLNLNLAGFAAGQYLLSISAGKFVRTEKLVLNR